MVRRIAPHLAEPLKQLVALGMLSLALLGYVAPATAQSASALTLSPTHSVLRFSVDTAVASLNGRFTRYSGKLVQDPQRQSISRLSIDIRISEVAIDPTEGFEYLSPESLFRSLPNPLIHFTSERIEALGSSRYRADGILTQGQKRWNVSLPFTAQRLANQGTSVSFRLTGKLAEIDTPLPLSLNPQRDRGSLEGRLVFTASGNSR